VGQDQVDARLLGLGEQHAAVDYEQLAVVLEDRHVAADLAEHAECDDPQRTVRERRGRPEIRVRVAHARTPPARRSAPSWVTWSGVAGTRGSRTPPTGKPTSSSAALDKMAPCVRNRPA
ncbi:MAG: hypothetical protein JWN31_1067, partial [Frankiales bacterium]|nr:hypothetical protein [Frankiales bacterium]